ncbi:MAG TPA: HAMP domain-containing sensor histidine kinase [Solirubrobacteraceae bacterium]
MTGPASLRARITLAALVALLLGGALAGGTLLAAIERDGRRAVDRDLRERAQAIVRRAMGPPGGFFHEEGRGPFAGRPGPPPEEQGLLAGTGTFVQVAVAGHVLEQRGDVPAGAPAPPAEDGLSTVRIAGHQWRALTSAITADGRVRVEVLSSLAPVEARVSRIRRIVVLVGLAALGLTALAAWGFTTLAVRPLARLRAGAARVSGTGDLSVRLADDEGPVEVRSLAHDLNEMLRRLQASTAATRRFAADAGHELRTPLTGLRANLDALARNPDLPGEQRAALLREMTAEQERMVHLLEGLQALARGEAADALPREEVELGDLVDAAVFSARRRHPAVRFELGDADGDAVVRGWGDGLRLLVDNLLDNAAVHGRPDGEVRVSLERDDGAVVLEVDDDGPGVPAGERTDLLEPFARGTGASAPGTGLGLAIVAQQVALHDGALDLRDSPLGGLGVRVRLPAQAAA